MKGWEPAAIENPRPEIVEFIIRLDKWSHDEVEKEQAKASPSESRVAGIQDKRDCLHCFADGANTTEDILRKIDEVFTDNKHNPGVTLSSIHKSKGLEYRRVFFLMPKGAECPCPWVKLPWEKEAERNLRYVGTTRAIEELYYVTGEMKSGGL
jgi:superfamily I DNA/RNA helicase